MRIDTDFKVSGKLLQGAKANEAVVNRELTAAMHASTQMFRGLIIPATPVGVSGMLRGGTAAEVSTSAGAFSIEGRVFNPSAYGLPVELGRGAGKRQPPSSALELWVRRKLGVPDNRVKSVAFLIARKIGRQGTKAVEMFTKAFASGKGQANAYFDRAASRIAEALS